MEIGPITADDVDAVGQLLAASFVDDPGPVWWWPDPAVRSEVAPQLFAANARLALAKGDGMMTSAGDAVALYLPPGTEITEDDLLAAGMPEVLGGFDRQSAEDVGQYFASLGALQTQVMPEAHWQLFLLGVHPSAQGKGLGVALVDEVNDRAVRDGVPVYLDTLSGRNVGFCQRRGYRIVGESDIPNTDVHVWGMRFN